jgi:oligopeptide/dipeptide ABC transporter ATP-binding protein
VSSGLTARNGAAAVLEVDDLEKHFRTEEGTVRAVDGVSLSVEPGEVFGIVGESGSGKSTLGRLILKLTPPDAGEISFFGERIDTIPERKFRDRRREIQIVLQDPVTAFNPRWKLARSLREFLRLRGDGSRGGEREELNDAVASVGLDPALLDRYPRQVSGGQLQRLAVARALLPSPKLLVVDEPTSALDVSIRGQIVNLLLETRETYGLTLVLISHDLSVVRAMSDRVAVMYLGQVVEVGTAGDVLGSPAHPYTRGLLDAMSFTAVSQAPASVRLKGEVEVDEETYLGCRLVNRCPFAEDKCHEPQGLLPLGNGHAARCWKADTLGPYRGTATLAADRGRAGGGGEPRTDDH